MKSSIKQFLKPTLKKGLFFLIVAVIPCIGGILDASYIWNLSPKFHLIYNFFYYSFYCLWNGIFLLLRFPHLYYLIPSGLFWGMIVFIVVLIGWPVACLLAWGWNKFFRIFGRKANLYQKIVFYGILGLFILIGIIFPIAEGYFTKEIEMPEVSLPEKEMVCQKGATSLCSGIFIYPSFLFPWGVMRVPKEGVAPSKVNFRTTKLSTASITPFAIFSPNGKKVAYVVKKEGKYTVAMGDGVGKKIGKFYVRIGLISFSPNGQKLAYIAKRGKKEFVVVNEKEGKAYDGILPCFLFSPNSRRLAYLAKEGKKQLLVIRENGSEKEIKKYGRISSPVFSPDSQRLAYIATKEEKSFLVVREKGEEKKGKKYDLLYQVIFSPDSQKIAYIAKEGKKELLVIRENGSEKEIKKYDYISSPVFSPDSQRLAYIAHNYGGKKWLLVIRENGSEKEIKKYVGSSLLTSPLTSPVFSPDNQRTAYVAKKLIFFQEEKKFVVFGEREGKAYDSVGDPVFSPDGQKVAYTALKGKREFVVIGEREGNGYDRVFAPVFSPDSQRVAYTAKKDKKWFVVVEEMRGRAKVGKGYDHVFLPLVFSPDSKYIAYGARKGRELWWIVNKVE